MQLSNQFPQEHYIELTGLAEFLKGRITLLRHADKFMAEIDIIQIESGKIHNHVAVLYDQEDPREALDLGVHHLKQYLNSRR